MATQELNVKFKVDSSELKSKSDEAKQKVKNTASEMASDVKNASSSMEKHLDNVAESAKNIGGAAKTAGASVKTLENQVSQSSNKMAGDLGKVADQIKNISARQVAGIASRGLGMAAGFVGKIGEDFEEGSSERLYADMGASALNGAASGVAMGAVFGPIGAALGGAAGALMGAANELWNASKALDRSIEEQQRNAEQEFQSAGREKNERNRLAGYQQESAQWIKRLQQDPWIGQDKYESIDAVYSEQQKRQNAVAQAQRRYDDFVSQHRYDSGQAALDNLPMLETLRRGVQVAQERLQAFAPVVQTATQMEESLIRAEEEEAKAKEQAARTAEEAARKEAEAAAKREEADRQKADREAAAKEAAAQKAAIASVREEQKLKESELSDTQRQLQGLVSRPMGSNPNDALTKIGGGVGYASYNNSTAAIQTRIENHLKQLADNQKNQLQEIITRLEALSGERVGVWGT